ncbi:phosphotriesterase family protein [Flexivirga caeni]|uniref:Phosphotriesterase n=1 Tax=Flexivirga caeni TaxID=2294115 RepID=A0A3M9MCN4_9MICO|nr:phosphotriesterase [Flexivirga caeni]RNI23284.1 phosphotriesterase [Flexivirga caeni]
MTVRVRTVLGDVPAERLGVTDAHDHFFFRSHLLPGVELDDAGAALAEAQAFAAAGGRTVVQWTPRGLGRHRAELAALASATGINIISATGRHRREHYAPATEESFDELRDAFGADIADSSAPCGVVKIGTGYHHLDEWERISLQAAAMAHRETGVPIAIHLELGTAGEQVIEVLTDAGAATDAIILGHVGRHPEERNLLRLADCGVFMCFDGPSRANHRTDWRTPDCIRRLVERGHGDQLLIGGDTTTAAARSVTAGPGMPHLLTRFGADLRLEIGDEAYDAITVANPRRAFALRDR